MDQYSDEPGLLTWVYPFHEFHEAVFGASPHPGEPFFSDWFMRNAVNAGLPVNTVVSTDNFISSREATSDLYRDTILVTPVPVAASPLEAALIADVRRGQRILFYGSVNRASQTLLELLNLKLSSPLSGELEVHSSLVFDVVRTGSCPRACFIATCFRTAALIRCCSRPAFGIWTCAPRCRADRLSEFSASRERSAPAGLRGCEGVSPLPSLMRPCRNVTTQTSFFPPSS